MKNKTEIEKKHNKTALVFLLSLSVWALIFVLLMEDILSFSWGWIIALCVLGGVIANSGADFFFPYIEYKEKEHPSAPTEQNYLNNINEWREIEDELEGKTIITVASNDVGIIIRFTDGTKMNYINNKLSLENDKERGK